MLWKPMSSDARGSIAIHHLLARIGYEDLTPGPIEMPPRQSDIGYIRPPISSQTFVPECHD